MKNNNVSLKRSQFLSFFKFRMTDYFQELNCEPIPENETQAHQNLLYARFLQQHGILMDEVENLITAPPASKEVVCK